MRMRDALEWVAILAGVVSLVGCSSRQAIDRQAAEVCGRLAGRAQGRASPAADRLAAAPSATVERGSPAEAAPVLYFAPRQEGEGEGAVEPSATAPAEAPKPVGEPIDTKSFSDVLKSDLRVTPRQIGRGFKHAFADPVNLVVLGAAFGTDRIVRHNLDSDVRDDLRDGDTSMAETGDFGSVIGNPALHFGIAGAWYLAAVRNRDARQHQFSKTMIEALAVNGMSTMLLKVAADEEAPNGQKYGWPSGHTSSSVCFAAVMHEYYGWKAGVPLYLLAGYSAATRLEDREHDLSDLVFGAALGWVVGHSVVKGELPEVAGFQVLPYGSPQGAGLMFVKQW